MIKLMQRFVKRKEFVITLGLFFICILTFQYLGGFTYIGNYTSQDHVIDDTNHESTDSKYKEGVYYQSRRHIDTLFEPNNEKNDKVEISKPDYVNSNYPINSSASNITNSSIMMTMPPINEPVITEANQLEEIMKLKNYRQICGNKNNLDIPNMEINYMVLEFYKNAKCVTKTDYLFVILSKSASFYNREKIRDTYCSMKKFKDKTVKCRFIIHNDKGISKTQRPLLMKEYYDYFDLIIFDEKRSIKTDNKFYLKVLELLLLSCPKTEYYIIVNDDIFISIPTISYSILTYVKINSVIDHKDLLLCKKREKIRPVRNRRSMWYVQKYEWPKLRYPTFCDFTNGLIMSSGVAKDIFACSKYIKQFWIADIFLTGLIPEKMSIKIESFDDLFKVSRMNYHFIHNGLKDHMYLTNGNEFSRKTWRLLFNRSLRDF